MSLPAEISKPRGGSHGSRIGDLVRRLGSASDNDVVLTVRQIGRVLKHASADFHALAEHIENSNGNAISEADLQRVYDNGFAVGAQHAENKLHGATDFHGTDGKPDWVDVALFLQRNKHRLADKHHEFVDDMASRTAWEREPTIRQHQYLHSLFYKLGGKIT